MLEVKSKITAGSFTNFFRFKVTEQLKVLLNLDHKLVAIFSGNQAGKCLTYETLVETPNGEIPIGELYDTGEPFKVYAWDGEKRVIAQAGIPIKKAGLHTCYKIMMSDGRFFGAADHHKILTTAGWLSIQDVLYTYSQSLERPLISINGNQIISYVPIGNQEVYDFEVEKYHNYISCGLVHHNTATAAQQYFLRIMGKHPIEEKNILARKIRCMSSSLPESSSPEEQDNMQYLELKKVIPPEMIERDITARSKIMVVRRPLGLSSPKTVLEFRSSKQDMIDLGKIQLSSVWHDEETPKGHREECKMRLLAEGGDELFTLTPTGFLTYTFDEIFQRASFIYRTKTISEKFGLPRTEKTDKQNDVACILMATDDNPTLDAETIENIFAEITDPDILAIRRYGVFKQISGRIHKTYNPAICYISMEKTFGSDGIPDSWMHCRGIDYHNSRTPWSIGWMSISPQNEWFLWQEFHPSTDGPMAYNTYEICKAIVRKTGDYECKVNLIDPLAAAKQPSTLFSVIDDMNRYFQEIRRNDGLGYPSYWKSWDTKDTKGRDQISLRFKNSVLCGKPFNNRIKKKGENHYLPTLWIMDTCPKFNTSLINWRYGEYVTSTTQMINDPKATPQQKYSHDCMVLECLAKDHIVNHANALYSASDSSNFFHRQSSNFGMTGRRLG